MGASPPYMLRIVEAASGSCDQVILDIQQGNTWTLANKAAAGLVLSNMHNPIYSKEGRLAYLLRWTLRV